ncbi:MAG: response regulator [Proteobacteria bacterium]|nr:response regulator [Pseudomonadota bacterium]
MRCNSQHETVLLVDDEQRFVDNLAKRLKLRGFNTLVAYDCRSAIKALHRHSPGLMVLDLRLPDIDGVELLRRVKENHPRIQVIILTGHGTKEDYQECLALGAHAFLHKPVNISELTELLSEAEKTTA